MDEQGAIFRRQYHLNPYLSGIGESEIRDRLIGITDNLARYDADGRPRLLKMNESFLYWRKKVEEIAEELRGRGNSLLLQGDQTRKVIKLSHDLRTRPDYERFAPWGKVPKPSRQGGPLLFKFGRKEHLKNALCEGRIRISPAGCYADPKLDAVRRDEKELCLVFRPSSTGLPIVVEKSETGATLFDTSSPPAKQLAIEIGGDRDYYAWCCTKTYEPRLYIDFLADACLVIRDIDKFFALLDKAVLAKSRFVRGMIADDVRYYDPLSPDDVFPEIVDHPLALYLYKDFRYAYQAEYRFIWPVGEGIKIHPINVNLGSLKDICELLVIG